MIGRLARHAMVGAGDLEQAELFVGALKYGEGAGLRGEGRKFPIETRPLPQPGRPFKGLPRDQLWPGAL